MAADKDKISKAATQITSLLIAHMDAAGLSLEQRERNVRAMERISASRAER